MVLMNSDEPWLTQTQQQVWRRWLLMNDRLTAALSRDMQRGSDLSLQDFGVLVHLTDVPDGRVRIAELAIALNWERSRLSHHITRMERRGLVRREECSQDGRGAFAAITTTGRTAIEGAAPSHACTVRRLVFDDLTDEELQTLGVITDKVLARLET
jgi:DNA-binding MarR family transcriptional regulator